MGVFASLVFEGRLSREYLYGEHRMSQREQLIEVYRQMYELTKPECDCSCPIPHSCCSPEYCEMAEKIALEHWGVDISSKRTNHPRLPFMSETGCVVEPHLRPLCTLHTCDINSFGFKMHPNFDPEWDKKYFDLRDQIDDLEFDLHDGVGNV